MDGILVHKDVVSRPDWRCRARQVGQIGRNCRIQIVFVHVGPKLIDGSIVVVAVDALVDRLGREQSLIEGGAGGSVHAVGTRRVHKPSLAAVHETQAHEDSGLASRGDLAVLYQITSLPYNCRATECPKP
eukprot:3252233-Rhodomonas_salina.1